MCGIIGYLGERPILSVLIEGLKRLEYRGYDSSGVAAFHQGKVQTYRAEGKLNQLTEKLQDITIDGTTGIGHIRWATHGRPSEVNAHPHKAGRVVLVHNGIVENYRELKEMLRRKGVAFQSETDTEVIAHLIDLGLEEGLSPDNAIREALKKVRGSYALGILFDFDPDTLYAARMESPLVLGLGDGETFFASDVPALLPFTRRCIFLHDGEMAKLTKQEVIVTDLSGKTLDKPVKMINWSPLMAEKEGFKHFMLKEIHEQPRALIDTFRGIYSLEKETFNLENMAISPDWLKKMKKISIIACGTSWHAALVGRYYLEELAGIPTEVDIASEFRYRNPLVDDTTLLVAISQSGETADTLAGVRIAKEKGAKILSVCNVFESSLTRLSDGVAYTHAGPEIAVASTKAFTTQLAALFVIAMYLGCEVTQQLSKKETSRLFQALTEVPSLMQEILKEEGSIKKIARKLKDYRDFLYLGRGLNFPIALEGALKLKEISYIHAEGYPAGEMKHGPIALISPQMPVVFVAPSDRLTPKVLGNMEEVLARDGQVISVATQGAREVLEKSTYAIEIPQVEPMLEPLLTVVPLQLLAYHIADLLGTDVDQPRNLAKSVTVE
ncbi:MAG: glutamine--fructose-6-phosphate transaminase (isomerizing) [Deltaproteobacteria bacterium]|nr:glutamine--fructose-6-phosphate transaminase (isomerizing) [Deltaproteobacteria bacterium]